MGLCGSCLRGHAHGDSSPPGPQRIMLEERQVHGGGQSSLPTPTAHAHIPLLKATLHYRSPLPLTTKDLARLRREFWETASFYGGSSSVWASLRLASECANGEGDYDTARAILDSAGVVLPRGLLTEAYDETGFRYVIPPYCIATPTNMLEECDENEVDDEKAEEIDSEDNRTAENNVLLDLKGSIRIRLSNGIDVRIACRSDRHDLIKDLRLRVGDEIEESPAAIIMLWRGRVLRDQERLSSLAVPAEALLQAIIKRKTK